MQFNENDIILLTTGCYSDHQTHGPFKVMKAFDQETISAIFRKEWKPEHKWERKPDADKMVAWLSINGYIKDIDGVKSWHLGDYEFSPDIGK